jgi:hypothetical protein
VDEEDDEGDEEDDNNEEETEENEGQENKRRNGSKLKGVLKNNRKSTSNKKRRGGKEACGRKRKPPANALSPERKAKKLRADQSKQRRKDISEVEVDFSTVMRSSDQPMHEHHVHETLQEINESLIVEKDGDETVKQLTGTQVRTVLLRYGLYEDNGGGIAETPSNSGGLKAYRLHIDLVR